MLILPASTYNTTEFMSAAGELDVVVVAASDRGQVLESQFPEGMLQLDFDEPGRVVEQISEYDRQWPLHSIIGVDDHAAWLATLACEALSIPHNSPEAVRAAGSKLLMRQQLQSSGLPTPAFEVVDVNGDAGEIAARVRYPCVLKPLFLAASRGVIRADDAEQFAAAFERIGKLLSQPHIARRGGEAAKQVLVEEYVSGAEVALEGLLVTGRLRVLALFDKPDPLEGPYFAETIYVTPSRLNPEMQSRVARQVEAAADALGLREGPVHAESRVPLAGCVRGCSSSARAFRSRN